MRLEHFLKICGSLLLIFSLLLVAGCSQKPKDTTGSSGTVEQSGPVESESKSTNMNETEITETQKPAEPLSEYEQAIVDAYSRAVLYEGSDEMRSAIAAVLQKAINGEPVTFAALGDSITFGAGATIPEEKWISVVAAWLEDLDGDPSNGNVTLVNAGIGGTEAVYGAARIERDVLPSNPDLVMVDFGTNDFGLPHGAEGYEGILTKLISAGIPVINSNICPRSGNNIQNAQLPINKAYGVPQVSFREAYYELSKTTEVEGLRADELWLLVDNVHPTPQGHKLQGELMISYLQKEILDKGVKPGDAPSKLPSPVTKNGFSDAVLIENTTSDPRVTVELGNGWTANYSPSLEQITSKGWQTSTIGSSITFTTDSAYFYFICANTKKSGYIDVAIDGVHKETITNYYNSVGYRVGSIAHVVMHFDSPGEHTVTFTLADNPQIEKDWLGLCAVGAANFNKN